MTAPDDRTEGASSGPPGSSPLDWPRRAGAVAEVMEVVRGEIARRQRRRRRLLGAGVMVAAVLVLAAVVRPPRAAETSVPESGDKAAALEILRPRQFALPDGSVVELMEGAVVTPDFTSATRLVRLERGEAFFSVRPEARRPFVVRARGVDVRAVGTAFSVAVGASDIAVLVEHGRVAVSGAAPGAAERPVYLDGGQRTSVANDAEHAPQVFDASAELGRLLAWRAPRLQLRETPLAEVVAIFNRQPAAVPLRLSDPRLARLPVSGVIRADNTDVLLGLLRTAYGVRSQHGENEIVLSPGQ